MIWIDILIILPVLWFGFKGFKNGFIKEIASLAALFLGLWIASEFSSFLSGLLKEKTQISEDYIPLIAFIVIFILTIVLVNIIAGSLNSVVKAISLNWLNKMLGIIFGALKAVLIIAAVVYLTDRFLINKFELINPAQVSESLLFNKVLELIEEIYPKLKNINFNDLKIN